MNKKPLFYAVSMLLWVVIIYLLLEIFVLSPIFDKIIK